MYIDYVFAIKDQTEIFTNLNYFVYIFCVYKCIFHCKYALNT